MAAEKVRFEPDQTILDESTEQLVEFPPPDTVRGWRNRLAGRSTDQNKEKTMDQDSTRPVKPGLAAGLLAAGIATAFAPAGNAANDQLPSIKSRVHQCFYQNGANAASCPDGAFVSGLSAPHTFIADAGSLAGQAAQAASHTIASAHSRQYVAGTFYASGDLVSHLGQLYRCRPYPANNLCGQAPASYEPGTGWEWEKAWVKVK